MNELERLEYLLVDVLLCLRVGLLSGYRLVGDLLGAIISFQTASDEVVYALLPVEHEYVLVLNQVA